MNVARVYEKKDNLDVANGSAMCVSILVLIFYFGYMFTHSHRKDYKYILIIGTPLAIVSLVNFVLIAISLNKTEIKNQDLNVSKLQVAVDLFSVAIVSISLLLIMLYGLLRHIRNRIIIDSGRKVEQLKMKAEYLGMLLLFPLSIVYFVKRFQGFSLHQN